MRQEPRPGAKVGNDQLFRMENVVGGSGNDVLTGDGSDNDLRGGPGSDNLFGESGSDFLQAGAGKDFLTGGSGRDFFVFTKAIDSPRGAGRDMIFDFDETQTTDDDISLAAMDTKLHGTPNDTFKFIGVEAFHHKEGELRFQVDATQNLTLIQGDVNGDGRTDFEIQLAGQHTLHVFNFDL